jgi:cell division protein FtsI (penicillin-binding protein 3)
MTLNPKAVWDLLSVSQILEYSSNIGMVRLIQQMKPDLYYNWLEKLGLGQEG